VSAPPLPASGRRAVTRDKLLKAGLKLFSKAGVDGTTVAEITAEAGVGFGSFYNHFESKQALVDALIDSYIAEHASLRNAPEMSTLDVAEQVSAWLRFVLERAKADRDWGLFFSRTSSLMIAGRKGYIRELAGDMRRGMKQGRFHVEDFDITLFTIVGGNLTCLIATLEGEIKREEPSRVATITLAILGVDPKEAHAIAHRPLPGPMLAVLQRGAALPQRHAD